MATRQRFVPIVLRLEGERETVAGAQRVASAFEQISRRQAEAALRNLRPLDVQAAARIQAEQVRAAARVQQEETRNNGRVQVEQMRQQERAARELTREQERQARAATQVQEREAREQQRLAQATTRVQEREAREAGRAQERAAREAARDMARIEQERLRTITENERAVEQAARREADARVREARRAAREMERELRESARTQERARREAPQRIRRAGEITQTGGRGVQTVGVAATAAVTAPLAAGLAAVIKVGVEYEQAMNSLQAVTGATAAQMKAAGKVAQELGRDASLPATSAKDATLAMLELGKAGLTVEQSMAAAKGVLQLAAAGQLEEAKAAEITANALNAFSLEAKEATRVADLLAAASNASSAEVSDVALAMQQAAAGFAAARIPVEDLTTAIGELANAGIKGSDAGTSLKTFLSRLLAPASDAAAASIEKLGVRVFDAQGKVNSFRDIIGDLENGLKDLTDAQKAEYIATIFGSDASRAAQILIKQGVEGFDKLKEAVTRAGAAQELAAAKTKGLGGAWEALKSNLESAALLIYAAIAPALASLVGFLSSGVAAVSDFIGRLAESNPIIIQIGVAFLGLLAAIGPVLVILGTLIVAIGSVVSAFATISAALGTVGVIATLTAGFAYLTTAIGSAATAAIGFATTLTISTGGLFAIAIALAAVTAGIIYYATSTSEITVATKEQIQATQAQIATYTQQGAAIKQVQASQKYFTETGKELKGVYDTLSNASKDRVDAMTKEEGATQALADEINRLKNLKEIEARAQVVSLGAKLIQDTQNYKTAAEAATNAQNQYTEALANGGKVFQVVSDNYGNSRIVETAANFTVLRNAVANTSAEQAKLAGEVRNTGTALDAAEAAGIQNTRGMLEQASASKELGAGLGEAFTILKEVRGAQNGLTGAFAGSVGATNAAAGAVGNLVKTLQDLLKNTNLSPAFRKALQGEIQRLGDDTAKETKAAAAKITNSFKDLQTILNKLLADPRVSNGLKEAIKTELAGIEKQIQIANPQIKAAGVQTGNALTTGVTQGINAAKPAIQNAQKQALQGNPAAANAAGQQLGAAMGSGMIVSLRGYIPQMTAMAGAAVEAIKSRVTSKEGLDSHSPSRVFAGYGRDIIAGLIIGITENGPKLNAAIDKEIVNRAKAVKTDLQKIAVELGAILNEKPEVRGQRLKLEQANDFKSKLDELIKLRAELGVPVQFRLPQNVADLNAELERLNQRKANIATVKDLLKQFDDALAALPQDATNLEKVNALLADPIKSKGIDSVTAALLRQRAQMLDNKAKADELQKTYDGLIKKGDDRIEDLQKQLALVGVEGGAQRRAVEIDFEGNTPGLNSEQEHAIKAQRRRELALLAEIDAQTFLTEKLKQYNSVLNDTANLTERQKLELELQKPQLAALTEQERERLRVLADQVDARRQFDELTKQLSESFNRILNAGVKDGFRGFLKATFAEIKNFGLRLLDDLIKSISQSLARTVAGGLLGGSGGNSGGGGGIFGTILGGIGKLLGLGGGNAPVGATPGFNPAAGNFFNVGGTANRAGVNPFASPTVRAAFGGSTSPVSFTAQATAQAAQKAAIRDAVKEAGTTTAGAATQAAGKFSFGQFGTQVAALAPFLGLSIGASLGGQSGLGQILGGAGGLLGGLVLAASTGAIGGSLGSLFALSGALGPAALVAAPLLILGGILLGRAKQRRQDESQRDQLSGDIAQVINQAEATIRRASQVSEITGTLAQVEQRFSEYLQSVNAIKTRSVRESALRNQVPIHRGRIDALKQLAQRRQQGLELESKLVAEFATGGTFQLDAIRRLPIGFQGVVPGAFDRRDDHLIAVSRGERIIVLTPEQDREATPYIAPYLKKARVPGFAEGGSNLPAPRGRTANDNDGAPIELNLTLLVSNRIAVGPSDAADILVQALDTDTGRRANIKVVQKAIGDDEIDVNRRRR